VKIYLAIKYYKDFRNKYIIDGISAILEKRSILTSCIIRDFEKGGSQELLPEKLMKITFEEILSCDIIITELSEKGIGLGIEAGFAYAKSIPIIVVAESGSDISTTIKGIAYSVLFYEKPDDLETGLMKAIESLRKTK
jgi:2'-deoxynucleoside 5'-phosphate N-hydrolase